MVPTFRLYSFTARLTICRRLRAVKMGKGKELPSEAIFLKESKGRPQKLQCLDDLREGNLNAAL